VSALSCWRTGRFPRTVNAGRVSVSSVIPVLNIVQDVPASGEVPDRKHSEGHEREQEQNNCLRDLFLYADRAL